ncbi:MAG: hypothetical protein E7509_07160 [Ruminococcus sp.]|nr:hypothetical protein [Ruminococcus sp.]
MKKLLCVVISMIFAVTCFCSCKDEEEIDLQYEVPVETMFEALDSRDSDSFLRCFATPVLSVYEKSADYDENLALTIYKKLCETAGTPDIVVNHKVNSKRELSQSEINELIGDGLEPRHNIKKAFEMKVRVIIFSVADKNVTYSQEMTLYVGKLSGNWYVCQSPVMEWNLIKDVKG